MCTNFCSPNGGCSRELITRLATHCQEKKAPFLKDTRLTFFYAMANSQADQPVVTFPSTQPRVSTT